MATKKELAKRLLEQYERKKEKVREYMKHKDKKGYLLDKELVKTTAEKIKQKLNIPDKEAREVALIYLSILKGIDQLRAKKLTFGQLVKLLEEKENEKEIQKEKE